MNVVHWSIENGSGLHRVAESLAKAEGSRLVNSMNAAAWEGSAEADIHVIHSHLPPLAKRKKGSKIVWVGHGTPDHVYHGTVEAAETGAYGHSDPMMLTMHWLKEADARVTFWDRHKWIYDQMLTTGARKTDLVPMGVDLAFWKEGTTAGKFAGEPSMLYAENPHYIKWVYDLMTALPAIAKEHPGVMLHNLYQVKDHHRAFFPWFNALGATFHAHVTPATFAKESLRNAFKSVDYVVGLVRYGDLNHLSMEANAAGSQTISYAGNPYADFWVAEGDQREIARQVSAILSGQVEPRAKTPVPDLTEMVAAFQRIYGELL